MNDTQTAIPLTRSQKAGHPKKAVVCRCSSKQDFFSKCDQIRRKQRIWSHLLKKSLMEKFIFGAVKGVVLIFFILRVIFDHTFRPKIDKLFLLGICFPQKMSNVICDL